MKREILRQVGTSDLIVGDDIIMCENPYTVVDTSDIDVTICPDTQFLPDRTYCLGHHENIEITLIIKDEFKSTLTEMCGL